MIFIDGLISQLLKIPRDGSSLALTHPDKLYNPGYWVSDGLGGNEGFTNQNSNASTGKKEFIIFLEVRYFLTISEMLVRPSDGSL